jgi:hypothetical protein
MRVSGSIATSWPSGPASRVPENSPCQRAGRATASDEEVWQVAPKLANDDEDFLLCVLDARQPGGGETEDLSHLASAVSTIEMSSTSIESLARMRFSVPRGVAHPNKDLLDKPEAQLAVNAGRTLLTYLDATLGVG